MIAGFQGTYRWLSNFWPAPVVYEGVLYPTTEHAYQAAKTEDTTARLRIAQLLNPGDAKRAGRSLRMRPDWDNVKRAVMLDLLRQKFAVEPLRSKLLATEPHELFELNTWGDTFWGVVQRADGFYGLNVLGNLLMQIRKELKT